jgi:endosialidase-like protein
LWRSDEFPDRHFGNSQNYGLIAQDVEQVLPELVATDSDGYKAVDYSKLPLLTIQAVKELKAENEARKAENDTQKAENVALKQRVAELERLVTELLAAARR